MIESGQISEKDPVQKQLQDVHKATTKKYEVQAHAPNRGKSQWTTRQRAQKK